MSDLERARIEQLKHWAERGTNDATPTEIRQLISALAEAQRTIAKQYTERFEWRYEFGDDRDENIRLREERDEAREEIARLKKALDVQRTVTAGTIAALSPNGGSEEGERKPLAKFTLGVNTDVDPAVLFVSRDGGEVDAPIAAFLDIRHAEWFAEILAHISVGGITVENAVAKLRDKDAEEGGGETK